MSCIAEGTSEARKSPWSLTVCRRHQLAEKLRPEEALSRDFLRALRRFDPEVELYWHPMLEHWILYRRAWKAAVPAEDQLVKELDIVGANGESRVPSWWLLEKLRRLDKTLGGSVDPARANREYLRSVKEDQEADQRAHEAFKEELAKDYYDERLKYAYGRHSVHVNRM